MIIDNLSTIEKMRLAKVDAYRKHNIEPFFDDILINTNGIKFKEEYNKFTKEELSKLNKSFKVAGRLMNIRGPFLILQDVTEKIQIYVSSDLKETHSFLFKNLDIGDIIWIEGNAMKTNTGILSLRASNIKLVTKSIKMLPEKFHGLKNTESRYRQRYVDLIANNEIKELFIVRTKIIKLIRKFFDDDDYMEVDTPILQTTLGGALAKPFITFHNAYKESQYLRIATELPLKKLLVGGFTKIYEIGRIFRNEGVDTTHNPEFTTIEFYEAYSNLFGIMDKTEKLIKYLVKELDLNKESTLIDLEVPFSRINMVEELNKIFNVDFYKLSFDDIKKLAVESKIEIKSFYKKGHLINELFEEFIEKKLIKPTFVLGHPQEISPLAKSDANHPGFSQRAELFIYGKEYANIFNELNDPLEQLTRFSDQLKERKMGNDEASEIDRDFIMSLLYGMPPAGGCGIGLDRLIMLLTRKTTIRETILFPHLRKKND